MAFAIRHSLSHYGSIEGIGLELARNEKKTECVMKELCSYDAMRGIM